MNAIEPNFSFRTWQSTEDGDSMNRDPRSNIVLCSTFLIIAITRLVHLTNYFISTCPCKKNLIYLSEKSLTTRRLAPKRRLELIILTCTDGILSTDDKSKNKKI